MQKEKASLVKQWKECVLLYPIFRKALPFRVIRVLQIVIRVLQNVTILIIYMGKFLHSDWLRAVQFFFKKQCRKELIQCKKRKQTKHSDWSMIRETHRWPIKSFVFSNQAHALDGAIFP